MTGAREKIAAASTRVVKTSRIVVTASKKGNFARIVLKKRMDLIRRGYLTKQ